MSAYYVLENRRGSCAKLTSVFTTALIFWVEHQEVLILKSWRKKLKLRQVKANFQWVTVASSQQTSVWPQGYVVAQCLAGVKKKQGQTSIPPRRCPSRWCEMTVRWPLSLIGIHSRPGMNSSVTSFWSRKRGTPSLVAKTRKGLCTWYEEIHQPWRSLSSPLLWHGILSRSEGWGLKGTASQPSLCSPDTSLALSVDFSVVTVRWPWKDHFSPVLWNPMCHCAVKPKNGWSTF